MRKKKLHRFLALSAGLCLTFTSAPISPAFAADDVAQVQAAADKTLLNQSIAEAQRLQQEGALDGVNELVTRIFTQRLAEAQAVANSDEVTQDQVNDAWFNLTSAIQMLSFKTDKDVLKKLVEDAEKIDLRDHYSDGHEEFKDALLYGKEILASDTSLTDQSIQEAIERLNAALEALVPIPVLPLYRVYNPNSGEHHYTSRAAERDWLVSLGWDDEGIGWYVPAQSGTPVYRLYNPNDGDHHYTTSNGERQVLIKLGWDDEDIGWYSDDKQTVNVYRLYNPNAKAGAHHYTINKAESDWLTSLGWHYEGVGMHSK